MKFAFPFFRAETSAIEKTRCEMKRKYISTNTHAHTHSQKNKMDRKNWLWKIKYCWMENGKCEMWLCDYCCYCCYYARRMWVIWFGWGGGLDWCKIAFYSIFTACQENENGKYKEANMVISLFCIPAGLQIIGFHILTHAHTHRFLSENYTFKRTSEQREIS